MRILLTGGTGFIGQRLVTHLHHKHQLVVLSRSPRHAYQRLGHDVEVIGNLDGRQHLNEFDAVINLAGEPIADKRWTDRQKERICLSRWQLTERLSELIKASSSPPAVFISGSAIGYYGAQQDQTITETFTGITPEFTHEVCRRWEELALAAESDRTRVCIVRTGVVLGREGGVLRKMLPAYRMGFGGPVGDGRQYISWIHINDMVKIIIHLLNNPTSRGVYNATAPHPVPNAEFSNLLARQLHRPNLFWVPRWFLQSTFGEMAELLLGGQKVVPARLLDEGFHFSYPELELALRDSLHNEHALNHLY